jgi:hypothetical protein
MPGRKSDRKKHRAPCAVTLDGRRHNGFLIDYSQSGMFIQTSASPKVGQRLDLELVLGGERLPMHVEVARRRAVPAQLRAVAGGGIGVRILSAPEVFYTLVAEERQRRDGEDGIAPIPEMQGPSTRETASEAADSPAQDPAPLAALATRYRVRVRATQGNRSRSLEIESQTESGASRLALEERGEGWKVIEASPVATR